ncbi:MAG TPA: glycosyltransferase [Acidimicrobiia bacterium]|nr:glycosyltransferase [Acidimicrobiia bacterium]
METIDPDSISADLLERDDETEPASAVPPVVAVVVTNDAGPWFEEGLAALGAQDYPSLSVLVVDNGSGADPTERIASALPGAFVRRCSGTGGHGFAAAANEALASIEGAVFLLFCHDDVVFDPDAVRLLVEEAYRSNAGIVGPKLVARDNPDVLVEVGMSIDHYGVPFSGIEPGEVDQEQHDGVRDVFYVSHATMLVRADLFHELAGFDPATFPGADDIDLCWRARLAGARVIVAPAARVRDGRATLVETRRERDTPAVDLRAETRSRVRLLCKSYSALALAWVLPVAFVLSLFEAVALLVTGRVARARAVVVGWFGAFTHPGELRRARSATQRMRSVDDGDVRDLMIRGSARLRRFMLERVHAADRLADVSTRTRVRMDEAARRARQLPAVIAVVLGVLILFGCRSLLVGHVPEVGSFQAWPGVGAAWSTFTGSWRTTMMGAARPASPVFAFMAAASAGLIDHPGLARSLLIGGAIPLGAFGAYRLLRPFASSSLPGIAAAAAYAANPVARNAIWHGELGPLVCFALAPYVLGAFVRATDDDTADDTSADATDATDATDAAVAARRRHRVHGLCSVALLIALVSSVWPPALFLAPALAIGYCIAVPFAGGARHAVTVVAGAVAASVIGLLLLEPWSFTLFGGDATTFGAQPRASLSFASILHFQTGRAGAGLAAGGIIAAAVVPLAIATGPRLAWATRAWVMAAMSFAIAWLPGRLSAGATSLSPDGVLVVAAIALAFAAGLGVAAVLDDLRRFHFGWRQIMMIVAVAGLALSVVGFAGDTFSGRFGLHADDWAGTYSWMNDSAPPGGFRVLWVGDPNVLPADAMVASGVGFALTRDGVGDARASWSAPEQRADRVLGAMIEAASSGSTVRLGHLLAPAGVRYIAFVQRAAPSSGPLGRDQTKIADALSRQLDLTLSRVDTSGLVYDNDAWIPSHALVPASVNTVVVDGSDPAAAAVRTDAAGVVGVGVQGGTTNAVGPGTLLWSEAADPHWSATANGHAVARHSAFGWTNAFALDGNATVHVHYAGSRVIGIARFAEIFLWIGVLIVWFATRRGRVEPRVAPAEDA